MHLLTFVRMKDPGFLFRGAVILGQVGYVVVFDVCCVANIFRLTRLAAYPGFYFLIYDSLDSVLGLHWPTLSVQGYAIALLATLKRRHVLLIPRSLRLSKTLQKAVN